MLKALSMFDCGRWSGAQPMKAWFKQLDELLRGKRTRPELLATGDVDLPLRVYGPLTAVLGAVYGFFMGWYAIFGRPEAVYLQVVSSLIKLPALFLLTLVVTFPSLYVFNALMGCRLTFGAMLRLLMAAIVVNLCVAASFGPILGFFTVSTTSYAFMVILNVALLAVAGLVGMAFLLQTLRRLSGPPLATIRAMLPTVSPTIPPAAPPTSPPMGLAAERAPALVGVPTHIREPGPLDKPNFLYSPEGLGAASVTFRVWVFIYAIVGLQMGWLLRPFILTPDKPFVWLRGTQGNAFEAVAHQLRILLGM
jgi:hypothetical protein